MSTPAISSSDPPYRSFPGSPGTARSQAPTVIEAYLETHAYLHEVLACAPEEVRRVFGDQARLALELLQDPDAGPEGDHLFLLLRTALSATEARPLLERLDEEWWLDTMPETRGRLSLALRFE